MEKLRKISKNNYDTTILWSRISKGTSDICSRKHLLNGLISAATSDAVAAMKDEASTGKVDEDLIVRWISSLAFIPR